MPSNKIIQLLLILLTISACSSKELYDAGKQNRQSYCREYVGPEYEQCLKEINNKSYEDYQRERQQVINDKTN
ncbi:hypothetical protein tinsulaeT_17220 [Thalassotalea insulae]|uniref:Lipoprotein n=1 Tax=Thalassotalea insulae TaxID=2056778 RepID=A0ABQ6GSL8_9GAMM|nr:hypothetical protein [Thalassotalea insulae]GLX78382.1 hypothetical protein tinsulaeT_17220 [Thalassotalea insulae]